MHTEDYLSTARGLVPEERPHKWAEVYQAPVEETAALARPAWAARPWVTISDAAWYAKTAIFGGRDYANPPRALGRSDDPPSSSLPPPAQSPAGQQPGPAGQAGPGAPPSHSEGASTCDPTQADLAGPPPAQDTWSTVSSWNISPAPEFALATADSFSSWGPRQITSVFDPRAQAAEAEVEEGAQPPASGPVQAEAQPSSAGSSALPFSHRGYHA